MRKICLCTLLVAMVLLGCRTKEVVVDNDNRGPVMISTVKPVYPEEAQLKGIEGDVWVKMWVDTLGRVTRVLIEKTPDQALCDAAMTAALKTKFKPAMLDGKPIGVWLVAPFAVTKGKRK
ncbi:MAG: energy transducer TonB [Bacteroidota bacterium]